MYWFEILKKKKALLSEAKEYLLKEKQQIHCSVWGIFLYVVNSVSIENDEKLHNTSRLLTITCSMGKNRMVEDLSKNIDFEFISSIFWLIHRPIFKHLNFIFFKTNVNRFRPTSFIILCPYSRNYASKRKKLFYDLNRIYIPCYIQETITFCTR